MTNYYLIINLIASIIAIVASIYLVSVVKNRTAKNLQASLLWIAGGIALGLGIHSFFEFLESIEFIGVELLIKIMPIFVLVGCIMILIGSWKFYQVIRSVSRGERGLKRAKIK